MEECKKSIAVGSEEIRVISDQIQVLADSREGPLKDELNEAERTLKEREKVKAKVVSSLKTLQDNVRQEEKKKKQVEKGLQATTLVLVFW